MSDQPVSTPSTTSTQPHSLRRGGSVLFPILLIALGILFLTQTMGLVPWEIWGQLWRFWPVVLILIGIDIIVGRRSAIGRFLMGILAIAMVGGVLLVLMVLPFGTTTTRTTLESESAPFGLSVGPGATHDLALDLGSMESATIRLDSGAADVRLSALESTSDLLIGGAVHSNQNITQAYRDSNGTSQIDLRSSTIGGKFRFLFGGSIVEEDWDLKLTQKIPLTLDFNMGATSAMLDLSSLTVTKFTVDAGASSIDLIVPRSGHTRGLIDTGAANISIEIPEGVAAKISIDGGLSSVDVDQSRFPKVGDNYVSPDYDNATDRIDLSIDSGISSISIR